MSAALIGHTGFVGSNLLRQRKFDACFNSKNFRELEGQSFDTVVCAGIQAVKWWANQNAEADWQAIANLLAVLERVECRQFVLISTIDVYPDPENGEDESAALDGRPTHAYGANRLQVEQWVTRKFANHRIVRLPALFGAGLRKNALFDLLHNNLVDKINPAAQFQWYPLDRLQRDLQLIDQADLKLVNLFTEPVSMASICERYFPAAQVGPAKEPAPKYRLTTKYASLFAGQGGYMLSAPAVLDAMGDFVAAARPGASA